MEPLLELIKVGLGKADKLPYCDDWHGLMNMALKQGVPGITFDAIQSGFKVEEKESINLPTTVMMEWFGMVNQLAKLYDTNKKTTEKLGLFYAKHGIPMMLLKGYGLSLNYPVPEHRPSGDIDIYLFGEWKKADKLLAKEAHVKIDNSHHHHSVFHIERQMVENHYDFLNVHSHRSNRAIEEHFKELAKDRGEEIMKNVFLPSPLLEVEFTARHAASHFASGEMTIRQLLDWLLLAEKKTSLIAWDKFWHDMRWMGMEKFVVALIDIGIDHLGFDKDIFHIPADVLSDKALSERMVKDILYPVFNQTAPRGFIQYIGWMIKRWWANRWRHEIVYSDSLFNTFIMQLYSHVMKPTTLYKK
jgi:hypothetical protein